MAGHRAAATGRHWKLSAQRSLAHDPVLGVLALGILAVAGYLLSGLGAGSPRIVVFWGAQVGADVGTAVLSVVVVRSAANPAIRRFWVGATVAAGLFAAGDALNLVLALRNGGDARAYHAGQAIFFVLGCLVLLAVMVTYPARHTTAKERLRFWLDATTVLVGCGVFAWCLLISPILATAHLDHLVESLVSSGVVVLIGFALVRLLLSGDAPVTKAAVVPIMVAVVLQASGDTLEASGHLQNRVLLVVRVLPALLLAAIPRIQAVQTAGDARPRRRRRPYSLLPYLTIAATFGLLCAQLAPAGINRRLLGALVGMAVITVLVVVRQLNAFEENAELLERLAYQASHDPLTGLANRTVFTDSLRAALDERDGEHGRPVAVVLVDLDGFKAVNDTLGHYAGDLMLVAVADRLRASVRPADLPARLGGDEFAVLLPGATAELAGTMVERFLRLLDQPVDIDVHRVRPYASVGAVVARDTDPETLLRTADAAMYRVKHGGKGSYAVVDLTARDVYPLRSAR